MNYNEILFTSNYFGSKSVNNVVELSEEFMKYAIIQKELNNTGKFWVLGKSILTISNNNNFVFLFKSLSSKRWIKRIKTPERFPYCSEDILKDFAYEIITAYNENFHKF